MIQIVLCRECGDVLRRPGIDEMASTAQRWIHANITHSRNYQNYPHDADPVKVEITWTEDKG